MVSIPSIPGMTMSTITRSKVKASTAPTAVCPHSATTTR